MIGALIVIMMYALMALALILVLVFMLTPAKAFLMARLKRKNVLLELGNGHGRFHIASPGTVAGWWKYGRGDSAGMVRAPAHSVYNVSGVPFGVVAEGIDTIIPPYAANAMRVLNDSGVPLEDLKEGIRSADEGRFDDVKRLLEPVLLPFSLLTDYLSTMAPGDIIKIGAIERQKGMTQRPGVGFGTEIVWILALLMGGVIAFKMLTG